MTSLYNDIVARPSFRREVFCMPNKRSDGRSPDGPCYYNDSLMIRIGRSLGLSGDSIDHSLAGVD